MKHQKQYIRLASRLIEAAELDDAWEKMSIIYGKKTANNLRKLVPADPTLLYDLAIVSYIGDGMKKKDALEKIAGYSSEEWEYDFKNFKHTIVCGMEYGREYYQKEGK